VATSQNFGIVGNGKLEVFENTPRGLVPTAGFYTRDALYEVAWSEQNENHIIGGCGDGSIKLWDVTLAQKPLRGFEEHSQECASVDWNPHVRL
jgi:peroxin-7